MRTRVSFNGFAAPAYAGAACASTKSPSTEDARSWSMMVGGAQVHLETLMDFQMHVGNFLRYAYDAGVKDERERLRASLGL